MVKITPVVLAAQEVNKLLIYQGNKAQVWAAILIFALDDSMIKTGG